jgi:hypothetical protein
MPRREEPLDAARIVRTLAAHRVDYVIIGGLAVQAHGHVRTTQDADLLPAPQLANLERLAAALTQLRARPAGSKDAVEGFRLDADTLAAADVVSLETDAGGVDVHRSPPGSPSYADVRRAALVLEVTGVEVPFVGLDDLIAMKRVSRRPIDLGDIAALTELERR